MTTIALSRGLSREGVRLVANESLKRYAAGKGVYLWQIAREIGIMDSSLSRKLRVELPEDQQKELRAVIDRLSLEVS